VRLCGQDSIVIHAAEEKAVCQYFCDSWECPSCSERKRACLIARILAGFPSIMWTLTSRVDEGSDPVHAFRELVKALQDFMDTECKRRKIRRIQYFVVVEATKQGWPHLHLMVRDVYIDHARLSDWMDRRANSPIVHFDILDSPTAGARYMSKYLGKAPHRFGTGKRCWCTHSWDLKPKPLPWREKRPGELCELVADTWTHIRDLHIANHWLLKDEWANKCLLERPP
jgi:hypothetical protein